MMLGDESNFSNYWEQIVEPLGSFLLKTLHMIYINLTIYNIVLIVIKYLSLVLYMERFLRNMYKESQKRMKLRNSEIEDILLRLDIMNAKISCQEEECREREETLKRCTHRLRVLRAQVRQVQLPIDVLHSHGNNTSEEESKLFEELIKECKFEQNEEPVDEKVPCDRVYDTVGSVNGDTSNRNDENRDYTIKIVKVTNAYRMSYLQHYLKQKKLQKAKDAILKKKTKEIQMLFNGWQNILNDLTKKDAGITSEAMVDNKSYELLRNTNEDRDELDQNYVRQSQCLTYGNYSDEDMAPESEIMAMDYTSKIYDNRYNYQTSLGDQPVLPVLLEETNSDIEIETLDVN